MDADQGREVFGISPGKGDLFAPANVITVGHARALEQKATLSLELTKVQISKLEQDMSLAKESHEHGMKMAEEAAKNPAPTTKPGEEGNPAKGPAADKRLQGTPTSALALAAVLNGLHDFEMKAIKNLRSQLSGDDPAFRNRSTEWLNSKFAEACSRHINHWKDYCESIGLNLEATVESWILQSVDVVSESPSPLDDLVESHSQRMNTLFERTSP
jgi:hypothetical protein